MVDTPTMSRPLTVSMTPAFMMPGDMLLRAQLRCLSEQAAKDFTVLIVDHHYSKRVGYMDELRAKYKLDIVHVPYAPNPHVGKRLDCAIFNAPYLYSESPRIVRYSCWRFVKPDFTKVCLESPTNVDFYFHSVKAPSLEYAHPKTDHNMLVWDMASDRVNWAEMPVKHSDPGATWGTASDSDEPAGLFRRNCYGNYLVFRDQWLAINGCEEAITSCVHWEDQDFCIRARNARMVCTRKHGLLYRLNHHYGGFAGRANIPPDQEFKKPCDACAKAYDVLEPNRFDLKKRVAAGELDLFADGTVWVCKTCLFAGPVYHANEAEYLDVIENKKRTQSNTIAEYKLGRRLRRLAGDMDRKPLARKIEIFNESYSSERYYQ